MGIKHDTHCNGGKSATQGDCDEGITMATTSRALPAKGVNCAIPGDSVEVFPKKVEMDRVQSEASDLKVVIVGRRMDFFWLPCINFVK